MITRYASLTRLSRESENALGRVGAKNPGYNNQAAARSPTEQSIPFCRQRFFLAPDFTMIKPGRQPLVFFKGTIYFQSSQGVKKKRTRIFTIFKNKG
ncbi:MAG: hypothetical protein V1758_16300, partial [Pseudomonadota bacterium]